MEVLDRCNVRFAWQAPHLADYRIHLCRLIDNEQIKDKLLCMEKDIELIYLYKYVHYTQNFVHWYQGAVLLRQTLSTAFYRWDSANFPRSTCSSVYSK
jgi:hypothetical protein